MAQASEQTEVLAVPADGADKKKYYGIPVLKWVLAIVLALIVSTVGGAVWVLQEVLAVHPVASATSPWEFLFGSANEGAVEVVTGPLSMMVVVWFLLTLAVHRSVRSWGVSQIKAANKARQVFDEQLEETETKLGQSNTAAEFWKGQAKDLSEKVRVAEAARTASQQRMDQLATREKALASEQNELSRSKDRLEKHVEARTVELQRLQQRYVSILDSAGEGICSCDIEGRISFANPAAASIMGWSSEELVGQGEASVFADHGLRRTAGTDEEQSIETSHISPVVFQRQDGAKFPVEVVRTPVEEGGRKVGTVLIFKDVTERTEADERFATKAAELARSNSELEQFAFMASHDLQEPLRKIQAFGDRLKDRVGDDLTPVASDYLGRMQSASARMQALIDGLLLYSRVLTRAQPCVRVELGTVVKEVIEDLEVRIEKAGAVVDVGELPSIEADPLQIRQLMQNLIGNALKFQAEGNKPQVSVSARIISQTVESVGSTGNTELRTKGDLCELTVADNGVGFDEAYLKRLFVVFQRLHSRSEFEGTGIGLAVCRKIANRHGGSITARSKLGEGSSFIVLLPLRQPPAQGGAS